MVTLTRGFYLAEHPVTWEMYDNSLKVAMSGSAVPTNRIEQL